MDNQQKLIDEFMTVTEGDNQTAQEYLKKHSWKVVEAINDYFEWMINEEYCRNEKQQEEQEYNDEPDQKKAKVQHDDDRQKLIDEFMAVTEGDNQTAQEYLKKHSWKVVEAINDYFEWMHEEYCRNEKQQEEQEQESNDEPSQKKAKVQQEDDDDDDDGNRNQQLRLFRHITYNIDSLNEQNLKIRIKAICKIIMDEKATIVFLQEVRNESEQIIRKNLSNHFEMFSGFIAHSTDYYTMTLVAKKSWIQIDNGQQIINFKDTRMGRNILRTDITIDNAKLCLLNTHLESTKEFSAIRQQQLAHLLRMFDSIDKQHTIIAAGDFNLRDKELAAIGGLPSNVQDAWLATGRRREVQYTWDMLRNDNLRYNDDDELGRQSSSGDGQRQFKPRMRFDRVFVRCSIPSSQIDLVHFGLIGLQRLKPHVCFPSDHWGVITSYQIYPNSS
ncbi:tyrosyl-DNA phosphodiesterase 2 [Dermatophagoides farinae]|uniref:tyrosyl-DNA phosphodiesterase 2 n=1 Tax=Dermatophagoides farinae TaxID=6954 RepID=UPI003F631A2C